LATLCANYPIKTLQNIIDFNNIYMKTNPDAFRYGQEVMIRCNEIDLEARKEEYLADRRKDLLSSRDQGIDYLLQKHNLDALIYTSHTFYTLILAARAGYPTVSIPLANPGGTRYPINLRFTGTAFSEAQLIEFAYAVEQAICLRTPPGLAEKSELGEVIRVAQGLSAEERRRIQDVFDLAYAVYQSNFS
jgi:amidase